jgi:spore maturation protein CgeB
MSPLDTWLSTPSRVGLGVKRTLKIAIFGLTISSSWGNGHATPYRAILRALHHRKGHQITFFEKDVPYYALRRDFNACEFCELVLYSSWEEIRAFARRSVAESDAVISASYCPDGARIIEDIIDIRGPAKIFYDLDTPITLSNLASGDLDYLRRSQIPYFETYLSFTGGRILDELVNEWGAQRARPLYGCVDPQVHAGVLPREEFRCDFSYMGTYAADRQQKLEALFLAPAERMIDKQFMIAGSLYPWEMKFPLNVRRIEHVAPVDHPVLYSSSRATLNITRNEMARCGYCPSGRFFEAAACSTPVISDWFEGLDTFFEVGGAQPELILAKSSEDVIAALGRSDDELAEMAGRARRRALSQHTGEHRAEDLIRYIEEAMSGPPQTRTQSFTAKGEVA